MFNILKRTFTTLQIVISTQASTLVFATIRWGCHLLSHVQFLKIHFSLFEFYEKFYV